MSDLLRFLKRRDRASESGEVSKSLSESVAEVELREVLSSMSVDELALIDVDELREFLADDGEESLADPAFKERLRRELWWMMVSRLAPTGRTPSS